MASPQHRLRRHHHRPAHGRPHDEYAWSQAHPTRCSRSAPARATSPPISSNLTPNVWSIEIIPPLAKRTRELYDRLIARGYSEYRAIRTRNADGYYGWEEFAPFDKIIVTCGIDHIPPPLLQQLTPDGIMVIPVGPPGAQHVIKAVKRRSPDGSVSVVRSDIYGGAIIPVRAVHRLAFLVSGGRSELRALLHASSRAPRGCSLPAASPFR